jgi:hypothetical protein
VPSAELFRASFGIAPLAVTHYCFIYSRASLFAILHSIHTSALRLTMEAVTQDEQVSRSPQQERTNTNGTNSGPSQTEDKGPVLLSFPSILRNPGLNSRYAHLAEPKGSSSAPVQPKKAWRRNDNEGKRWVRRRENGASIIHLSTLSLLSNLSKNKTKNSSQLVSRITRT